jgi:glyoxylase-like metal-dependent hydrolase (beta-lactamase superfamily II)
MFSPGPAVPAAKETLMMKPLTRLAARILAAAAAAVLGLAGCASVASDDAATVLRRADQAMGGAKLMTLRYAGTGTGTTFGQAYQPGRMWPRISYSSYSRVLDYGNSALREDAARSRAEVTGGGAVPLMGTGEQRTSGWLRGDVAWNMAGTTASPAQLAVNGRIHDLWTTPHGIIKAALRNPATVVVRDAARGETGVAFSEPGRFSAIVWINADNLVERIDSRLPDPVMGDIAVMTTYSDYKDFGGVKFPMRIRQSQGGFPVLDLQVSEVQDNIPAGIEVPANVVGATERVTVEPAAPGVWFLAGGSHNSVAIEMRDHLIVVESPLYDGRALPVLEQARKLAPGKEIRYVINSHHHFDHSGGLRAAASQGITLVTSEAARAYFEATLANPNRIQPDAFEKSGRKAVITGVNGKRVFSDGTRNVEVYYIEGSVHAQGFMMVYLPAEKILIEADAYTPGAPNAAPPAQPNANNVNLADNIARLKLDVDRILPLHGRMTSMRELNAMTGK